jgi:RNA polymerase sigma factor (sigma-70 family)
MLIVTNEFIVEHTGLVKALLRRKLHGHRVSYDDFEELVTDVFIKCIENARWYNTEYSVTTFIGLQVGPALYDRFIFSEDEPVILPFNIDDHDTPEELPESDEDDVRFLQDKLRPYLPVLSPSEREVIHLHVYARLPVGIIASRLGYAVSSVSRIKSRAEQKLRRAVEGQQRVDGGLEVDVEVPLKHAIKQLPLRLYHAYRLHVLEGASLAQTGQLMGLSVLGVSHYVDEARFEIRKRWGFRG